MKSWSISARLWGAVALVVVGLGAVVVFAAARNQAQRAEAAERTAVLEQRLQLAGQWQQLTGANVVRNMALMLSSEPQLEKVFKAESAKVIDTINTLQQRIEALELNAEEKAVLQETAQHRAKVLQVRSAVLELRKAGEFERAAAMVDAEFLPARDRYVRGLDRFVQLQQEQLQALRADLAARSRATVWWAPGCCWCWWS